MTQNHFTIAIQPDDYTAQGKPPESDASSPRWKTLLEQAGHRVRMVDVYRPDILAQVRGCDGFMWRWAHFAGMGRVARRLLPVIERHLKLAVYPDLNTCWHYDDKIAQAHLLASVGIPTPQTWIWFDRETALDWADTASYPLVMKLAGGAGSNNVRLIRSPSEAHLWIDRLFSSFLTTLDEAQFRRMGLRRRAREAARALLKGTPREFCSSGYEPQTGYVLLQEFLPRNDFDTRITVIGDRAFGFRRFNRDGDFRASGSGKIDWTPESVDTNFVRLAFRTSRLLQTQSLAVDGLYRDGAAVVGEVSYTYVSEAVFKCPGHWVLAGDPDAGALAWVEGRMWPEEAQVQDFLIRLDACVPVMPS